MHLKRNEKQKDEKAQVSYGISLDQTYWNIEESQETDFKKWIRLKRSSWVTPHALKMPISEDS